MLVCNFIGNVITGSYNENGEIFLDNDEFETLMEMARYYASGVSLYQAIGLAVSILATLFLSFYSCYLHRALTKKAPWRPRRARGMSPEALAGQVSRQNSGIVMGRSRSGSSFAAGALT
uniref:Uncharacterized protein n=1 Tax=Ditylum brightwellii TaxID=49249 RepID=A0A6V2QEH1_9STRA